ncbi:MAG: adenylate/guanylate cyclase domain-containing protein [Cyclobacteriaceae bacterium]
MARLVFAILLLIPNIIIAQNSIDELESAIKESSGKVKLILLHQLTDEHLKAGDDKKALKAARQAVVLADRIIDKDNDLVGTTDFYLKPLSYFKMGVALFNRKQFTYASEYFDKVILESTAINYTDKIEDSNNYLDRIRIAEGSKDNKFFAKLKELEKGISNQIINGSSDLTLITTLKLARNYEAKENYPKAIEKYEKAIDLMKDKGDGNEALKLQAHLDSLEGLSTSVKPAIAKTDKQSNAIDLTAQQSDQVSRSTQQENLVSISPRTNGANEPQQYIDLARKYEQDQDYSRSLTYYKLYLDLNERLKEEEHNRELLLLEQSNEIENREREIALLQQEKELQELSLLQSTTELEKQAKVTNNLIVGAILIASLAVAIYLLYHNKKKAHTKLSDAYKNLNRTQQKLAVAEKKISTLLTQQVSKPVAKALLSDDESDISQKFVCVMFLDIRGFTPFAESRSPEDIIQYQNDVFGFMIEIIEKNNGVINQFLGDGFMATFGAPVSAGNDCEYAYNAATLIIKKLEELNTRNQIPTTNVGIGLHAGHVVAGNVGTEDRKQYSITGNTVILASRIEQLNKQFDSKLLISKEVFDQLDNDTPTASEFEEVVVKGRKDPIKVLKVA